MGNTLYVSDLDGTLMQPGAFISEKSAELLNKSIDAGKLFTIATARTPATVAKIIKDVKMNVPAIVMTGASIWNPVTGQYSCQKYMDKDAVCELIDTYHRMKFPIFLFTLDDSMINIYHVGGELNKIEREFVEERINSPYKTFHLDPSGREILPEDFSKTILFYGMQPAEHSEATHCEARNVEGIRSQCYYDLYGPTVGIVDAFSPLATKANAIKSLKKDLGADKVVAFGDNLNDIPMLKAADVAVVVENAIPEVKAIADIIIGPNTADSVAEFIYSDKS